MSVKIGDANSTPRKVSGGSPQGTKMGNLLFTITIDAIEEANHPLFIKQPCTHQEKPVNDTIPPSFTTSTPYKAGTSDRVIRYLDESGRGLSDDETMREEDDDGTHELESPNERPATAWVDKFVDDVNGGQSHPILDGTAHITQEKEIRRIHATECQKIYETIVENPAAISMKVNPKKSKLLCISSVRNYEVSSFVKIDGEEHDSCESLKILGYTFGNKPSAEEHVKAIRKEYATKSWAIN